MSALTEILKRAETDRFGAACELGRGLMRGNRRDMKLGYSWQNAARAATNVIPLSYDEDEHSALDFHLEGFAYGLEEDNNLTYPAGIGA